MINGNTQTGWGAFVAVWIVTSFTFMLWLFTNIFFGVLIGAFTGWLLSHIFLGRWIAEGLNASGIEATMGELYKIGAAAGFLSGFFKFSIRPEKSVQQGGRGEGKRYS